MLDTAHEVLDVTEILPLVCADEDRLQLEEDNSSVAAADAVVIVALAVLSSECPWVLELFAVNLA